jgi:DNA-binding transcriptional LysR family regulator
VAYEEVLHGRAEAGGNHPGAAAPRLVRASQGVGRSVGFCGCARAPSGSQQREITLADVAGYPAVFPGGNTFTHHIAQRLFEREGLTPNITMSTNYMETIKMMVSIGIAWSVLPRTMLDDQVVRLPMPGDQLARQLGYITHTERTLSNAAKAFMSLLDAD